MQIVYGLCRSELLFKRLRCNGENAPAALGDARALPCCPRRRLRAALLPSATRAQASPRAAEAYFCTEMFQMELYTLCPFRSFLKSECFKVPRVGRNTPVECLPVAGGPGSEHLQEKRFREYWQYRTWVEAGKSRWGVGVEPIWVARLG